MPFCFLCGGRDPDAVVVVATAAPPPPPPPSKALDEETPVTSNRKLSNLAGNSKINKSSSSSRNNEKDDGGRFLQELDASVQQRNAKAELEQQQQQIRKKKVFHNVHPVQENVQAKMDWFEAAFGLNGKEPRKSGQPEDEPTETDMTETENGDDSVLQTKPIGSADSQETVRDCDDDPYEHAYRIWYQKGLLTWRPNSIPDPNPPPLDEDAVVLQKFHQHGKTKTCITCHKDTSLQISMVQCNYCSQPLYCSVFCRGNDRYKHAATCPGKKQAKVPWKAAAVPPTAKVNGDIDENDSPGTIIPAKASASTSTTTFNTSTTTSEPSIPETVASTPSADDLVLLGYTPSKLRSMETTQRAPMVSLFTSPAADHPKRSPQQQPARVTASS